MEIVFYIWLFHWIVAIEAMCFRGREVDDVSVLNVWSWREEINRIWRVNMDIGGISFMTAAEAASVQSSSTKTQVFMSVFISSHFVWGKHDTQ